MNNNMFSGLNVKTSKIGLPNQNDKSSMNTKIMRYSNMVQNSEKYIITNYRAPIISGNTVIPDNPILRGITYVQGNLNVVDNYDIDRYYQGPVTGYLSVLRDITSISGDVHTNDMYVSGNLYFVNSEFGFKSNVFSPSLVSYSQTTNAIYSYQTSPFKLIAYGANESTQMYQSDTDETILYIKNDTETPFTLGYCSDTLWNGMIWVATGYGTYGSIATSNDGNIWSLCETFNIFNKGYSNSNPYVPYGGTYSVDWNGNFWVVGGYGTTNTLAYSNKNADIWTPCDNNPFVGGYCSCVKWNGKIWLASGAGKSPAATLAYSYDGIFWTALDSSDSLLFPTGCNFVAWNNRHWIAGGGSSTMGYSVDGLTWDTIYTVPQLSTIRGAGWSGTQNKWIIVGDADISGHQNIMYSNFDDGQLWQLANGTPLLKNVYSVKWHQSLGYWLATGNYDELGQAYSIIKSTNGINWVKSTSNSLNPCYGVVTTNERTGYLYNEGNAYFLGEQVTMSNTLYINGDITTSGPNTGSLVIQGGISNTENNYTGGNSHVKGYLYVESANDSTNLSTGALIVANGGASINGNLYLANNLVAYGSISSYTGIAAPILYLTETTGTVLDVSSNAIIKGNLNIQTNLTVDMDISANSNLYVVGKTEMYDDLKIQGNIFIDKNAEISCDATIYGNLSVKGTDGLTVDGNTFVGGNLLIGGSFVTVNPYNIVNTTDSTSTDTGALIVAGGIGVAKSVVIGNSLTIHGTMESTSTNTGALIVNGGIGIQKSLFVGGNLIIKNGFNLLSSDESTSTGTGALSLYGGLGIAKSIYIGLNSTVLGTSTLYGKFIGKDGMEISGNLTVQGSTGITVTTGGAAITGNVNVVSGLNNLLIAGIPINNVLPNTLYATIDASFGQGIIVNSTQNSTSTSTGSIKTLGGIGIAKSATIGNVLLVNGTSNSTSTSTGSVLISGGIGITKNATIGGNLNLNQYLIQSLPNRNIYIGTSATDFSYNNTNTDNIILGYNAGITVKNGTYNTFLGSAANADGLGSYTKSTALGAGATITGSNQVVLGTATESIIIPGKVSGQESTSTSSGAIVVSGGVGISGNMYCGNKIVLYGTSDATATGTGALIVSGGGGSIKKTLYIGGNLYVKSATSDTALNVTGGATIGGNTTIVGNTNITTGLFNVSNLTETTGISTGACTIAGGVGINRSLSVGNKTYIYSDEESIDITSGALVLKNGGAGIWGSVNIGNDLYVGSSATINNDLSVLNNLNVGGQLGGINICSDVYNQFNVSLYATYQYAQQTLYVGSDTNPANLYVTGNFTVPGTAFFKTIDISGTQFDPHNFNGDVTFHNSKVKIINGSDSITPNDGTLSVDGGAAITKNAFIGHEMNSGSVKTNSIGIQYNDNNFNSVTLTFYDQSCNQYMNNRYITGSIPTDISIPGGVITNFTSKVNISQNDLISGGGIAYNGYYWVGVFNGIQGSIVTTRIYYSEDGLTWQSTSNNSQDFLPNSGYTRLYWNGVAWNTNMWVVCGYPTDPSNNKNNIKFSYDGYTWYNPIDYDVTNPIPGFYGHDVAWNGNMWVCVGRNNNTSQVTYSYNGIKWYNGVFADVSGGIGDSLDSVLSANGRIWVTCGSKMIYYSYDGNIWNRCLYDISNNFHSLAWNGQKWLCLGTNISNNIRPVLYYSTDGISWIQDTSAGFINPDANRYYKVIWNANLGVWNMSSSNALLVSNNAHDWVEITNPTETNRRYPAINIATSNVGTAQISGPLYGSIATFSDKVTLINTVNATTTANGALCVYGGVGIGGNMVLGQTMKIQSLTTGTVYSDANGLLSNTPSDLRFKHHIEDISYGLSTLMEMQPISYYWKDTERFGEQREVGFIAQDVEHIIPEIVRPMIDYKSSYNALSLDYAKLTPVLVKAIQELEQRVRDLEHEIIRIREV